MVKGIVVPVSCLHCGYGNRKKIGDLQLNARVDCSSCRGTFRVDDSVLNREVAKLTKAVDIFVKRLQVG